MKRIRLSPAASAYVKAEANYLRSKSPAASAKFRNALEALTRNLVDFPGLGHQSVETTEAHLNRFVMYDYLVDYEIHDNAVLIIAIRHGRQRPPDQLPDPDDEHDLT